MPDKLVDLSEKVTIPRVLFIYGSPRRGGNTDILTDRLAEGAESKGALVERLIVTKHTIRSCTGCEGCSKKGTCVLDDAMQGLYPLIERAHRMVVGSPVYFYGVTAQLKALVDRCQVYWRGNIFSMSPLDESWMAWREKVMWSLWPHLRETGYSRGSF
jgi:multimeric flavodoxin WrbA